MARSCGIYVRISSDPTGTRLGVTRQLQDCRMKAKTLGWNEKAVYEDNDVSASTTKRRPAYSAMLADLEAGRINAVIVWDLDRLTRRPIEIEEFIDLADRLDVALASVGGDVDLATDNGRMFARIKGAVARAEVERKSARQTRANQQRAEAGDPPGGRRLFGYEAGGVKVRKAEATQVRKAAEALLAGGSIHGIARDFAARGVLTAMGGQWRPTEVRRMLRNPRYASLRMYRGEQVGTGNWPMILDVDTHIAIKAVLDDPARTAAGPPRRYLLSGIAHCSVCDGRLFGATEPKRRHTYRCESRKHVSRVAEPIEGFVRDLVIGRLSRPDVRDLFARSDSRRDLAQLRAQEGGIRRRLDGLAEAFAAGDIDRRQLRAGSERLKTQLETVTTSMAGMLRSPQLSRIVNSSDITTTWDALEVDTQREVIRTLLTVMVAPAGRGARTFDPTTVQIEWNS
jgi:site-specific DNA recombinase